MHMEKNSLHVRHLKENMLIFKNRQMPMDLQY